MSYKLRGLEHDVFGKAKYVNAQGHTECVEFVRQSTGAPGTIAWKMGTKISEAKPGEILRGTAIATFDTNQKYPVDNKGKHAAIYLQHNSTRSPRSMERPRRSEGAAHSVQSSPRYPSKQ